MSGGPEVIDSPALASFVTEQFSFYEFGVSSVSYTQEIYTCMNTQCLGILPCPIDSPVSLTTRKIQTVQHLFQTFQKRKIRAGCSLHDPAASKRKKEKRLA